VQPTPYGRATACRASPAPCHRFTAPSRAPPPARRRRRCPAFVWLFDHCGHQPADGTYPMATKGHIVLIVRHGRCYCPGREAFDPRAVAPGRRARGGANGEPGAGRERRPAEGRLGRSEPVARAAGTSLDALDRAPPSLWQKGRHWRFGLFPTGDTTNLTPRMAAWPEGGDWRARRPDRATKATQRGRYD
jgi:hypothetical protein